MSRSYRKHATLTGSLSEKWDKQKANRRLRRRYKEMIHRQDRDNFIKLNIRDVSDEWSMMKDGRNHVYVSKDSIWYKKGVRK